MRRYIRDPNTGRPLARIEPRTDEQGNSWWTASILDPEQFPLTCHLLAVRRFYTSDHGANLGPAWAAAEQHAVAWAMDYLERKA